MHSIFLLGYMGCGKSTVGKSLAKDLNLPFVDLDTYIESEQKLSIRTLFEQKGELHFRKLEKKALSFFIESASPSIIALGGGTPCYFDNMDAITNSKHTSIYLKGSISTLAKRLMSEKDQRPMLSYVSSKEEMNEFIGKHLFERSVFYRKAQHQVVIDDKTTGEIITEVNTILA